METANLYEGGTGVRFTDDVTDIDEALTAADMNFEVLKQTIYMPTSYGKVAIPDHRVLVRSDKPGVALGIVGKNYGIIQPRQMLESIWPLIEEGEAKLDTLGGFKNNSEVFASLNFGDSEVVPGDTVQHFLTMTNSFNGSGSLKAFLNSNRLACMNQLQAIQQNAGTMFQAIRHTAAGVDRLSSAIAYLRNMRGQMASEIDVYRMLAQIELNESIVKKFLKFIFPDVITAQTTDEVIAKMDVIYLELMERGSKSPSNVVLGSLMQLPEEAIAVLRKKSKIVPNTLDVVRDIPGEVSDRQTYSEKRREQILELSKTAPGSNFAKNTLWSLVNGVTYYTDHVRSEGNSENRLKSAMTGWASKLKRKALTKAKQIAEEALEND